VHAAIYKQTLAVHPSKKGTGYSITFNFDSTYECNIEIYFCAVETIEPGSGTSIKFTTTPSYPEPKVFKFSSGKEQKFEEGLCELDLDKYKQYIQNAAGSYFPLVLRIVFFIVT